MNSIFTTPKGTKIALLNLKGNEYMKAAHRILWFQEETPLYKTEIEFPVLTDEVALAKVKVTIMNANGEIIRKVEDVKMEHKAHFTDFVEKAVTGAYARAVTLLGFGTAYALADLDEGERIVDAPQEKVISIDKGKKVDKLGPMAEAAQPKVATGSFNQDKKVEDEGGW
jgi:hypothetical protein